jgi:hypothetical protein
MPGTEHRIEERRTPRLSAPLPPASRPQDQRLKARRSLLLSSMEPVARNGLSLASNGCPLSEASIPGSMFPACYFAPCRLASRPGPPSAPAPELVCPTSGTFFASGPLPFHLPARLAAPSASTPLRDFYLPPDQSVQPIPPPVSSPSKLARSPLAPRSRFYF